MATMSPSDGEYSSGDPIDQRLLYRVAKLVLHDRLKFLALKLLGFSEAEYQITVNKNRSNAEQNFDVLQVWYRRNAGTPETSTVGCLVQRVALWKAYGYVDDSIWEVLGKYFQDDVHIPYYPGRIHYNMKELNRGDDIINIQNKTKNSLIQHHEKTLSTDWLAYEHAHHFSVIGYYIDLEWSQIEKKMLYSTEKKLKNVYDVFKISKYGPAKILIEGQSGIGKTCTMAHIAISWARGTRIDGLGGFEFVFLIQLKSVNSDCPMEQLVLDSIHDNTIPMETIKNILYGESSEKVLLLIDGMDEYKLGTNAAVDKAIHTGMGNCFIIITARTNCVSKVIRNTMNAEVMIKGLSDDNIKKYTTQCLESEELSEKMINQAKDTKIYNLFHIPIITLMVCVIFHQSRRLPDRITEVVRSILDMIIKRSLLKQDSILTSVLNIPYLLDKLGECAWDALSRISRQLDINMDGLESEVKILGVLQEITPGSASLSGEPIWGSFHHRMLQEFVASLFLSKRLNQLNSSAEHIQKALRMWFPDLDAILRHRQVILFTCELMNDPHFLIKYVQEVYDTQWCSTNHEGLLFVYELYSLVPDHVIPREEALHFRHTADWAIRSLSQRYLFDGMREKVIWNVDKSRTDVIPEHLKDCEVWIKDPEKSEVNDLLSLSAEISKNQTISYLMLHGVRQNTSAGASTVQEEVFRLSQNLTGLCIKRCTLSDQILSNIWEQLPRCTKLTRLTLWNTPSKGFPAQALNVMTSLTRLRLNAMRMSSELSEIVCQQLQHLPHLQILDLSHNCVSDCIHYLLNLHSLKCVRLKHSQLTGPDIESLTTLFSINQQLYLLDLKSNWKTPLELELEGLLDVVLKERPNQEFHLDLRYNHLSERFTKTWTKRYQGLRKIRLQIIACVDSEVYYYGDTGRCRSTSPPPTPPVDIIISANTSSDTHPQGTNGTLNEGTNTSQGNDAAKLAGSGKRLSAEPSPDAGGSPSPVASSSSKPENYISKLCKVYEFSDTAQENTYNEDLFTYSVPEALQHCTFHITDPHKSVVPSLLRLCSDIGHHQGIADLKIDGVIYRGTGAAVGNSIQLSRRATRVVIRNSILPVEIIHDITGQLWNCRQLTHLVISYSTCPTFPAEVLGLLHHLKILDLSGMNMPQPESERILTQIRHLPCLEGLQLSDNCLTGCLYHLEHVSKTLEWIWLWRTQINERDLSQLRGLVTRSKLSSLDLVGNELYRMEEALRGLLETALTHRPHHKLKLNLQHNKLPMNLVTHCITRCQATSIELDLLRGMK